MSLSCSINPKEHRKNILSFLPEKSWVYLEGKDVIYRNPDVPYPFRQESHFLYASFIEEPGCSLLFNHKEAILFIPRMTQKQMVWIGEGLTKKEAKDIAKVSRVCFNDQFEPILKKKLEGNYKIHCFPNHKKRLRPIVPHLNFNTSRLNEALKSSRLQKNASELTLIKKACYFSSNAHKAVMTQTRPGLFEFQVQAIFEKALADEGLSLLAYPSIVASGVNSAVLHYSKNQKKIKNHELLLIDAGGEYHGYASDITRTFPSNGKFSNRQKDIYEIVLQAQKSCIEIAEPGTSLGDLQEKAIKTIVSGLLSLGLMKGSLDEIIDSKSYGVFYPHGISHLMGIDVHDPAPKPKKNTPPSPFLRSNVILGSQMVITVEPGIYFIPTLIDNKSLQRKFSSTINWEKVQKFKSFGGVRIEDNVVIQNGPPQVITLDVPKEVHEIESIMSQT